MSHRFFAFSTMALCASCARQGDAPAAQGIVTRSRASLATALSVHARDGVMAFDHAAGRELFRWTTSAIGGGARSIALASGVASARDGKTIVDHDRGVTEWYATTARGIELGYRVTEPVDAGARELDLDLHFSTRAARSKVSRDARAAMLLDERGAFVARVDALSASDAEGRALPARFVAIDGGLRLAIDVTHATFPIDVDPLVSSTQTIAPTTEAGSFGYATALTDTRAIVGAVTAMDTVSEQGVAFVYERAGPGATWTLDTTLVATSPTDAAFLGTSVALDGAMVATGAYAENDGSGAAYVFTKGTAGWTQTARIGAPGAGLQFGTSIALAANVLVVGAPGYVGEAGTARGAAMSYVFDGTNWNADATLVGPDDGGFGAGMAFDGTTLAVVAPYAGGVNGVYAYARTGGGWGAPASLVVPTGYSLQAARAVALSGATIYAVGTTPGDVDTGVASVPCLFAFQRDSSGIWSTGAPILPTTVARSTFGYSLAASADSIAVGVASNLDNSGGAFPSGTVELFSGPTATPPFADLGTLAAPDSLADSDDNFGSAVAIAGQTVLVGASHPGGGIGEAYSFELAGGSFGADAGVDADSSPDSAVEIGVDAIADVADAAPFDVAPEIAIDTGSDAAAVEVAIDVGVDGASDVPVDVAIDAGLDAALDAGLDAALDAGLDVATDVASDVPPTSPDAAALATTGLSRCAADSDCASQHCVDGVCCDSACDQACFSCVLAIAPGHCLPEPLGYDLRQQCGAAGSCTSTCNGSGACTSGGAGTQCAPITCVDPTHSQGAAFCGGAGSSVTCATTLAAVADCAPYACFAPTGLCETTCSASEDCAQGFVCDVAHSLCVASSSSGGGGCAIAGKSSADRAVGARMLAALALVATLRRRRSRRVSRTPAPARRPRPAR